MKFLMISLVLMFSGTAFSQSDLHRRVLRHVNFSKKNKTVRIAFFDADSTLRVSLSGSVSANGDNDVAVLPFVPERIAEMNKLGFLVMIVSNQGGIAKGILPITTADNALNYTAELIAKQNPQALIHYIDFADQEDDFRKPSTGMANNIADALAKKSLTIDWQNSLMVGDSAYKKTDVKPDGQPGTHFSNSDRLFAENLKIPFYEANDFFGWRCHDIDVFDKLEQVTAYRAQHQKRCNVKGPGVAAPKHRRAR